MVLMRITPGELDKRITFWRSASVDDGTATVPGVPTPIGSRWAKKTDVSDAERVRAAAQSEEITSRFLVRADALTRTISGKDVLIYRSIGGDVRYEITGAKESLEREDGLEISAVARPDQPAG